MAAAKKCDLSIARQKRVLNIAFPSLFLFGFLWNKSHTGRGVLIGLL
jgi:hypothetical protein